MLFITCPKCVTQLQVTADFTSGQDFACSNCNWTLQANVFPAIQREPEKGVRADPITGFGEATCLHHPDHAAVSICDNCGAYMCKLCELPVNGEKLCPDCFNRGAGSISHKGQHRVFLYDDAVLWGAILPLFTIWGLFISVPLVLWFSISKFNRVVTPYRRHSHWKFVTAIVLAILQAFAITWLIVYLVTQ